MPPATPRWGSGINEAAAWGDDLDGTQASLVGGGLVADDAADDVEAGGDGDGAGGVDAAGPVVGGAGEVDGETVAIHGDGDADGHRLVGLAVVVHVVGNAVGSVGYLGDAAAGETLGVIKQRGHVLMGFGEAVALGDLGEADVADADGRDLRGQVALAVVGGAGVAADEGDQLLVDAAGVGEFEGRYDHPLLV